MIETILKRDGREVPFDASKITYAIERSLEATGGKPSDDCAERLCEQVVCDLDVYKRQALYWRSARATTGWW